MFGFGWRARIGCISPSVMEMIPFDFYRFAPDGFGFTGITHNTNSWSEADVAIALDGALDGAKYLGDRGVAYVVHCGAAHVASKGHGYDRGFLEAMRARGGVGATTSIRSAIDAMRHLGMKRVAIASPWPEKITAWVRDYIAADGIEIAHVAHLDTDFTALHGVEPATIYRAARAVAAAAPDADGLYMPGPQAPVAMVVDAIERDIRKPVIASTPADFWAAFRDLGVRDRIEGHGRLLASLQHR